MKTHTLFFILLAIVLLSGCKQESKVEKDFQTQPTYSSPQQQTTAVIEQENRYRNKSMSQTKFSNTYKTDSYVNKTPQNNAVDGNTEYRIDLYFDSGQITFRQVLEKLRNVVPKSLNIVVLWKDLERFGITDDSEVNLPPLNSVKLTTALKMILLSLEGNYNNINFRIIDNSIIIASDQTLARFGYETRIHDITDLSQRPANYRTSLSNSSQDNDYSGVSNR
jgi:hypothetical protein